MKFLSIIAACGCIISAWGADVPVMCLLDSEIWPHGEKSTPACEMVQENGKIVAVRFRQPRESSIPADLRKVFPIDGGKDLTKLYEGFAIEVRGDGSEEWGCITLGDGAAFGFYYFPVSDKNWKEFRVSFADMSPACDVSRGLPRAVRAGDLAVISFGDKWNTTWCNRKRPAFSYEVRNLRLLEKIEPVLSGNEVGFRPLADVIGKMKKGEPVQITCFGDSITAGSGLREAEKRYAVLLEEKLVRHYHNPQIRAVCVAVGGAHTFHSVGWLERDLQTGIPDVATMMIGYNSYSRQTPEVYRAQLEMWLRRLSVMTGGRTALILITPIPAIPRYFAQDGMARITRELAEKYGCTVAPFNEAFKKLDLSACREKFQDDGVHPNQLGHQLMADELFKVMQ